MEQRAEEFLQLLGTEFVGRIIFVFLQFVTGE